MSRAEVVRDASTTSRAGSVDGAALRRIGKRLATCERETRFTQSPTTQLSGISRDGAYAIQASFVRSRIARGSTPVGYKIGAGADPAFGVLFDDQLLPDGTIVDLGSLIQPAIEVEIGFILRDEVNGPDLTEVDVIAATESVVAAFEIVDSRIEGWGMSVVEIVADNGHAARVVLGTARVPPATTELRLAGAVLERDGAVIATGAGAAVLGHPARSVAWLARELARRGQLVPAGSLVLTGAIIGPVKVQAGDAFRAAIGGVGEVACTFS